jgi:hypothetical protein
MDFSFLNNPLVSATLAMIVAVAIVTIFNKTKQNKDENNRIELIQLFTDCMPVIEKALSEFASLYTLSKTEDEMVKYASEYLLNIIAEYTDWNTKYAGLITQQNIEKYLYPLFKKMYEAKIVKIANKNV